MIPFRVGGAPGAKPSAPQERLEQRDRDGAGDGSDGVQTEDAPGGGARGWITKGDGSGHGHRNGKEQGATRTGKGADGAGDTQAERPTHGKAGCLRQRREGADQHDTRGGAATVADQGSAQATGAERGADNGRSNGQRADHRVSFLEGCEAARTLFLEGEARTPSKPAQGRRAQFFCGIRGSGVAPQGGFPPAGRGRGAESA